MVSFEEKDLPMIKNNFTVYCFFLATYLCNAQNYHELYAFRDLLPFVDKQTMIICDIDNTIMIPEEYEGSDMWFSYYMESYQRAGYSYPEALALVLPEYARLQGTITVRPVEDEIPSLLKKWQSQNICVMGLTSRGDPVIRETIDLLSSISIDFSFTSPKECKEFFLDDKLIVYKNGVLFCEAADKGKVLASFLRITNIPRTIVFIDDTLTKILSVNKALEALKAEGKQFEYSCFHYRHLDAHIATLPHH